MLRARALRVPHAQGQLLSALDDDHRHAADHKAVGGRRPQLGRGDRCAFHGGAHAWCKLDRDACFSNGQRAELIWRRRREQHHVVGRGTPDGVRAGREEVQARESGPSGAAADLGRAVFLKGFDFCPIRRRLHRGEQRDEGEGGGTHGES
jgi:hypothetical protein